MRVLIGCEYSGIVRDAFYAKGHDAYSCDLLASETIGQHYQGDIYDMLEWEWDLIIMHPPCTALCVAGNRTYAGTKDREDALTWTNELWNFCKERSDRVCFENPVGVLKLDVKPQYIQPYMFGHMEQKKTGLWLHNLPPLKETDNVYDAMMQLPRKERERIWYMSPGKERGKERSRFYTGIASAMADQWG